MRPSWAHLDQRDPAAVANVFVTDHIILMISDLEGGPDGGVKGCHMALGVSSHARSASRVSELDSAFSATEQAECVVAYAREARVVVSFGEFDGI